MIELKNTQIYQQDNLLLDDLSLTIKNGQFWGIIGRNGMGKSTLLNALAGINQKFKGEILVDGKSLKLMNHQLRAQNISYLFQHQEPCLPVLVEDAVKMGRFPWLSSHKEDASIVADIISQCQINHLKQKSVLKLSGGERKKVEIATCLVQQSKYLLLDEPLNHLDVVYQNHIMAIFSQYSQKHSVIMVCHDIQTVAQYCTHVLMLLGKDCYLHGPSATILTESNLKRLFDDNNHKK